MAGERAFENRQQTISLFDFQKTQGKFQSIFTRLLVIKRNHGMQILPQTVEKRETTTEG